MATLVYAVVTAVACSRVNVPSGSAVDSAFDFLKTKKPCTPKEHGLMECFNSDD